MKGKDLLSCSELSHKTIGRIFEKSVLIKSNPGAYTKRLEGKTAVLIFEKPSLRTRVTFEAGVFSMGGHPLYLPHHNSRLGERESVPDVARNLERWVDLVIARVFSHAALCELADYASIPVINALSDDEHPCQALADAFTLYERDQCPANWTMTYVGDGNNVCVSLMLFMATWGAHFRCATPEGYEVPQAVLDRANKMAAISGGSIEVYTGQPEKAVSGANAVYTDVWASMGQEEESSEREKIFHDYQINANLMGHAKPGALVMHCLPAHRGSEITDEVIDGPGSVVFDQAENRLHVQKVIMDAVINGLDNGSE
jgi:ornithine carbamoyltransferase